MCPWTERRLTMWLYLSHLAFLPSNCLCIQLAQNLLHPSKVDCSCSSWCPLLLHGRPWSFRGIYLHSCSWLRWASRVVHSRMNLPGSSLHYLTSLHYHACFFIFYPLKLYSFLMRLQSKRRFHLCLRTLLDHRLHLQWRVHWVLIRLFKRHDLYQFSYHFATLHHNSRHWNSSEFLTHYGSCS